MGMQHNNKNKKKMGTLSFHVCLIIYVLAGWWASSSMCPLTSFFNQIKAEKVCLVLESKYLSLVPSRVQC